MRDASLRRGARGLRDPQRLRPASRRCARCTARCGPAGASWCSSSPCPRGCSGRLYRAYFTAVLPRIGGPRERRPLGLLLPAGLGRELPAARGLRARSWRRPASRRAVRAADAAASRASTAGRSRGDPAARRRCSGRPAGIRPERDADARGLGARPWRTRAGSARPRRASAARARSTRSVERLGAGDVEGLLAAEASRARGTRPRRAASLLGAALEIRVLNRCLASVLREACPDRGHAGGDARGARRARRAAARDAAARRRRTSRRGCWSRRRSTAARAAEHAREVERANEALRRAEAESRHRA